MGCTLHANLEEGLFIDEWIRSLIDLPLLDLALKKLSF
jgi:hypothetical protein